MGNRFFRKLSFFALFLLVFQLVFPVGSVFAATTSTSNTTNSGSLLPPSNLASQLLTPSDVKLTWSSVYGATGYHVYEIESGAMTLLGSTTSTSYTANNLPQGSHQFVVSTLSSGSESGPCAPITVDITYPTMAAPATLTDTLQNGNDIVLSWGTSQYAQSYNVYQIADDGSHTLVTSVTGKTTYTITNAPAGTATYAVSAVNSLYGESSLSTSLQVNVVYPTMAPPANFKDSISGGNNVTLTWGGVSYANSYKIYQVVNGQENLISTVTGTSTTLSNQPAGDYTYVVHSYSSRFGESADSSQLIFTVNAITMAPPANFTYSITNGNNLTLSWGSVTYADSYKVYVVNADGSETLQSTVTGTSVTYTNHPAGTFTYVVHSYSSRFGESEDSSQLNITVNAVTMAAPSNFVYTIANGNDITLNWGSVQYANSYKVYLINPDGTSTLKSTLTGTSVTYTNQAAGDYTYEVHSYSNTFGESAPGASQVAFTLTFPTMQPPANLTQSVTNINTISLSWSSVQFATSYKVYEIVNGQETLKSTVTGTSVTYTTQSAGDHTYVVHSYSSRFGESADSSQVTATVADVTMAAPTNFTYTIQNGNDIVLKWDAMPNATSYKVYKISNGQKTLLNTVSGTTITYTNQPAGNYTYEVHSYSSNLGESTDGSQVSISLVFPTMQPPTNVVQSIKDATDFTLNWDSAAYATSYKVYQVANGQKVLKSTVTGTSASFSNMAPGDYTYEVHSVSSRFGESADGTQLTFTLNGQTMQAPTNLKDTITNGNTISLSWSSVQYATSYKVYQVVNGQPVLKSTVTGTSVTYTNQPGGDYDFIVDSVSSLLGESPSGAEVTFTLTLPTMQDPANLAYIIQNGNNVVLTWKSVQYATSYKVSELVNGQENQITTTTGLSATISNVAAGDHTYVVHASNASFGDSPGSQIAVSVNQVTMQPPANLTQTIANGNDITLRWGSSTYANSYKVYQIVDGQEVLKSTVTGTSVTYTNQPAGDYTFVVHSYSTRFGESADSNLDVFTLVFPTMQSPANFAQTITNGNDITLKWSSSQYANSYKVYQIVDGQPVLKSTVTGTSVTYTNQPAGDLTYEVTSYSSRFGESDPSTVNFTLVWPVVQPPTLTDTITNVNNVKLTWNSVQWANEYHVYDVSGSTPQLLYKGTALSYQMYNLTQATHSYVVTAYNTRFGESADSNEITENIIYPVMQPPTASVTLTGTNSAQISWGFVTYANGYNVYDITSGTPVLLVKDLNNLSYSLSNLSYGDHQYYVTSYSNSFGESKPSSTLDVQFDTTPPVTTAQAPSVWTNQDATVTLTATDDNSGVANTYYSVNGSAFTTGTSFTVSQEGDNTVSYYSVDKAGNKETVHTIDVQIDKTAPTTTANASNTTIGASNASSNWSNSDVTMNLSATDAGSGVATTYYSINGSDYVAGTSLTISQEGDNKVSFYSVDNAGNKEAAQTIDVMIDKTAPVTTSDAPTTWSGSDVTVNLSATDSGSGVANTYYSVNGSDYVAGTSFTVSQDGENKVSFYSVDNAGNKETAQTIDVKVDKTPPVTTSDAPTAWVNQDVTVNLNATDSGSGVANTYYSINGSDYVTGTSFTVSQEGDNKVSFYSVDNVGNKEAVQTIDVKVDKTPPVTTSNAPTTWSNSDVTVNLSATDAVSGVANTYYSVNGSDYVAGTSFTVSQEGDNKVSFYSVDNAGNKEAAQTIDVKVDKTPPVTTTDAPTGWVNHDVTVNLSATDSLSGVANTYYSIDGAAAVAGTSFTIQSEGNHTVTYYSIDVAGNQEATNTVQVQIDKTPPGVTMNLNNEIKLGTAQVFSYTATDNLSGVATQSMTLYGPQMTSGQAVTNGGTVDLTQPGNYSVTVVATDVAGNTTTYTKQFVVYIPVTLEVTPKVIHIKNDNDHKDVKDNKSDDNKDKNINANKVNTDNDNKGEITVRVTMPSGYGTSGFDLDSVTLNGVKALNSHHGDYEQAKKGQFKFDKADFTWNTPQTTLEFQGTDSGYLVIGEVIVDVNQDK